MAGSKEVGSAHVTIGSKTAGLKKGLGEAKTGLLGLKDVAKQMGLGTASAAVMAAGAIYKIVDAFKAAVNETLAYNQTVREMTQVLGLSADETSRIIQVADDWGISIDEVRLSLGMMNKNGITPSIDNLAKLADEYVSTNDKSAFAAKAATLLGRNYQTLIPILAKGGDALRDQAAAIDKSLIATDKAIAESRKFEVAVDNLDDAWTGIKYTVGNKVIPPLTDLANALGDQIEKTSSVRDVVDRLWAAQKQGNLGWAETFVLVTNVENGFSTLAETEAILEGVTDDVTVAIVDETDEGKNLFRALGDIKTATDDAGAAIEDPLITSLDDLDTALSDATTMMSGYNKQLIFNIVSAGLNADQQLELAEKMGLIDPQTRLAYAGVDSLTRIYDLNKDGVIDASEATDDYITALATLQGIVDGMESKTVDVTVNTTINDGGWLQAFYDADGKMINVTINEHHNVGEGAGGLGFAAGADFIVPQGYDNDSFPFRAESGERVVVIPQGRGGNNFSTTINTPPGANGFQMYQQFRQALEAELRARGRSGVPYSDY